jgi:hypothetical protein
MSGQRPSLFAPEDDLNLSQFMPKSELDAPPVPPETMQRVSEENGFPSRAPKPRAAARPQPLKQPISAKSGRTVLLNARITQRARDRFHQIVESERLRYERGEIMHRPTLGEIVERALATLEREIGQGGQTE